MRKEMKTMKDREKIHPTECRIPENTKERYKGLIKCKMQRNRRKQ